MSNHSSANISSELRNTSDDVVTAIARLPKGTVLSSQSESERVQTLKQTADQTQQSVQKFATNNEGVTIKSSFWISNMVVMEVDTTKVSLDEIGTIPEVERVHENFRVKAIDGDLTNEPSGSTQAAAETLSDGNHTYGLEQINVPTFWNEMGTKGSGASVVVLDSGIDADHETLSLATNGWQEWDRYGNEIDTQPDDEDGHGTHVSGTVAGGNESSEGHIGVAPDVDLYHGGVLTDQSQGYLAAVVAGMQWSHDTVGADVVNMSLGPKGGGYYEEFAEPLQNMMAAGTLPVASCGNANEGTSGSPGNIYGTSIAVGASDQNEDIGGFSSGEKIVSTDDFDESDEPDVGNWPAEYIVPDIAAPGVYVYSSTPGNNYSHYGGTSMASPHVAGVAALLVAATDGDPTPQEIWDALEATAWKPDDWDESTANAAIDGKDTRYGSGIIDATAAMQNFASLGLEVTGDTISPDGSAEITVSPSATTEITVEDLWLDWSVSWDANPDSVTDNSTTDGTVVFSWNSATSTEFTLSIEPPSRYGFGEYVISLSATDGEETVETTTTMGIRLEKT